MPINPIEPPAGLDDAVRLTLDQLQPGSTRYDAATGGEARNGGAAPGVGGAAPLYYLGLDRIVAGDAVDAATLNGWRTLIDDGGSVVALADVDTAAAQPEVRQVSRGPAVAGLAAASAAAPEAAADGEYEQRVLQVPGISLTAVWLHGSGGGAGGGGDLLIPSEPAPPGVEAGRTYPAADLLAAVAPLAQERLDADPTRAS